MMPLTLPLFYHFFRWMEHTGDTLATVMGWLSSTQAGGATTFHNGVDLVRLWPTRGAAGVWYSLYTDGSKVTGYRGNAALWFGSLSVSISHLLDLGAVHILHQQL